MVQLDAPSLFSRQLSRGQLIALDLVWALVYPVVFQQPGHSVLPLVALGLPIAVRRIWPVPVFLLVMVGSVAVMLAGELPDPFLPAALAMYAVSVGRPRHWWPLAFALGLLCATAVLAGRTTETRLWSISPAGLLLLGSTAIVSAWVLGGAVRQRRVYAARAAERLAEQAVADERLRIARELHDIVAHSMGVIAVKSGVANHVLASRPDSCAVTREALDAIETASRSALTELRYMLGVLRSDVEDAGGLRPAPGLADLPALVRQAEAAGVRVDTTVRGADRLPEGVDVAVYRILQEALTNVVRHAAPTDCRVVVEADGSGVEIEVTDTGTTRPTRNAGSGHGLIGMRERVAVYDGSFAAGPRPEGGFTVSARLPCVVAR
ncbi:sensor histidine kinase [Kutzneria viridogrisea]|uniref:histidine kinase n=1 Tax=Kutzneria viridogrisea TaxID=47990 RepID=A0ABR6BIQ5_9PSEU|nr:signal transduction histidine kinase [Kutzneria viridogrisea]